MARSKIGSLLELLMNLYILLAKVRRAFLHMNRQVSSRQDQAFFSNRFAIFVGLEVHGLRKRLHLDILGEADLGRVFYIGDLHAFLAFNWLGI